MKSPLPIWRRNDESIVACTEKIKVMEDNFKEIAQLMQDAYEDGILMEVNELQMRSTFHLLVDGLVNPYLKK